MLYHTPMPVLYIPSLDTAVNTDHIVSATPKAAPAPPHVTLNLIDGTKLDLPGYTVLSFLQHLQVSVVNLAP